MTLWLLIAAVVALLLLGVPVAYALLLPSLVWFASSETITMAEALPRLTGSLNSFPLLAVPLFILMGDLANASRVTDRLYSFADSLLGHIRGGIGYVNVFVSFGFSWMSGSALADAGGIAKMEVPAMVKRGYPPRFAAGLSGASALIGPVMPPSIPAVLYAVAASVSLGGLLIAGIMPAVLITVLLCAYVFFYARKHNDIRQPRQSPRQILRRARPALLALIAPVILQGGILTGVFTPTESAAVAVLYIVLLGILTRDLGGSGLYQSARSAARTTGSVLLIVGSASIFGWIVAYEQGPQRLAEALTGFTNSKSAFLLITVALLLLVGTFLDTASALLIMVPVLTPVATQFGVEPLHFGMVVIISLMIGLITPPVGLVLYVLSSITGLSFGEVARGTIPYLVPLLIALLIVTFVPAVSLTLPELFGFL